MSEIFIKSIKINNVRHLHNLEIPLSETEKKHLIITGKNGSGKTSLLNAIKDYLNGIQNNQLIHANQYKKDIINLKNEINSSENQITNSNVELDRINLRNQILHYKKTLNLYEANIEKFNQINLSINNFEFVKSQFDNGDFVLAFFNAKRTVQLNAPNGIQKLEIKEVFNVDESANISFIQYLVNLKAQRSFARDASQMEVVEKIDKWFQSFEGFLKELFNDESVKLEFDSENFDFNIVQKDKEKFNFNTLSDGYSAILNIVTELIMRMEKKSPKLYELQGIVLIDEIETHLHIALQKQILPFLTKVFPKIQFVVTSHSPFVLNSISNAVVYDLELNESIQDMSGYSVEGIIEGYFDNDKYSEILKAQIIEYENLWIKEVLSDDELEKLKQYKSFFKNLPKFHSEELELKIKQIELSKLRKL